MHACCGRTLAMSYFPLFMWAVNDGPPRPKSIRGKPGAMSPDVAGNLLAAMQSLLTGQAHKRLNRQAN
jgi:hypothetical protein